MLPNREMRRPGIDDQTDRCCSQINELHGTRTVYSARVRSNAGHRVGSAATNCSNLVIARHAPEQLAKLMSRRNLPLFTIAASLPLFALAVAQYPGGNDWDTAAVGFRFTRNYVCALFQPLALDGSANASRKFAIPAMLMLCVSMAYMFWAVSRQCHERATRKIIEIFGIGTMVYTFLGVNTPMHDLLVLIAAAFFSIAAIGMLRMLHATRRLISVLAGVLCLALLIALAAMRHGGLRPDLAPITEWLLFGLAILWLTFVYYSVVVPNYSLEHTSQSFRD